MAKVYYNKLVRDQIQAKILAKGEECEVRTIVDDQELEQELLKKVIEEAQGFSSVQSRDEILSEYADLVAVLNALMELHGFSKTDIDQALKKNVEEKGLFKNRHFLHWSSRGTYKSNETPRGTLENIKTSV